MDDDHINIFRLVCFRINIAIIIFVIFRDTFHFWANTIIIQADSDNAFGSPTTIFSLALDTATLVATTTFVNAWTATDIYFRALPSAVNAVAPQNTRVLLDFTRAVR